MKKNEDIKLSSTNSRAYTPPELSSNPDPISKQQLASDADGNIRPLAGRVMSQSRSTDAWRQEVMTMLRGLGVTDNTTA